MNSNTKILLGFLAAPVIGALIYFLTDGGSAGGEDVAPGAQVGPDEPAPLAQLRKPQVIENEEAVEFMEARWGHLGDSGLVAPHLDAVGDVYFVEPRMFQARTSDGKIHYARAIAKPERIDKVERARDTTRLAPGPVMDYNRPASLDRLLDRLKPIEDPNDMPDHLRDEHPASPGYSGPGSGKQ
jgi:hypothetical protein